MSSVRDASVSGVALRDTYRARSFCVWSSSTGYIQSKVISIHTLCGGDG